MTQVIEWGQSRQAAPMADKFVNLREGEPAAFRVFSPVTKFGVHWVTDPSDPEGKKKKKFICPEISCPLCRAGEKSRKTYASIVLWCPEGTGKTKLQDRLVRVLEFPWGVYTVIEKHALDEDYGYPDQYDVKVLRTGKGIMTRYETTVRPVDKCEVLTQKLRDSIQSEIEDWSVSSLEELYKPADPEKIKEFLTGSVVPAEPVMLRKTQPAVVSDVEESDDDTPPFKTDADDDLDTLFD